MSSEIATLEPRSVMNDMAARYGMDKRAFEATLRGTIMPANTTNEQCAAFLLVAKQYGLNPFTKEIFAFPNRGGIQPVVSVDGWMKLVNEHPQFDGMEFVDTFGADKSLEAVTCKVFRKDRGHPVSVTEYMSECRRPTDTWKQWPARMLRHKAAIQAARYAFGFAGIMEPDEFERMNDAPTTATTASHSLGFDDDRKARLAEALEQYGESVDRIKELIAKHDADPDNPDHLYSVAEVYGGIPNAARIDLNLAPTKGGIWTTHERDMLKKLPRIEA